MPKSKKNTVQRDKQESESALDTGQMLELSEVNITKINNLKTKGKRRQCARTDE